MPQRRIYYWIAVSLVALFIIAIAFYFIFIDFFVDLWWFRSLKMELYFWLNRTYRFILSGVVTGCFFGIFALHFWLAAIYLSHDKEVFQRLPSRRSLRLIRLFQHDSIGFYLSFSAVLGLLIAFPFYQEWESALLYFFGGDAGVDDPVYGKDISFYLFSLPIYEVIQHALLLTASIIFILISLLYWLQSRIIGPELRGDPQWVKIHLSVLLGFVVFYVVWGFMLDRYSLLYINRYEPVFFGPGLVEMRYILPLLWFCILSFLVAALLVGALIYSNRDKRVLGFWLAVSMVIFFCAWGLRHFQGIPEILDKYVVKSNPFKTQKDFIEYNIKATSNAYRLDGITTIPFPLTQNTTEALSYAADNPSLYNIPVWDNKLLVDVYQQLQTIKPYYKFSAVDEDRYLINGTLQQVNIAARERNIDNLPYQTKTNWENKHLRYTHGYGAVITPAAQIGDEQMNWYLRNLDMYSDQGIVTARPDIFYGFADLPYAIVPNNLDVSNIPGTDLGNSDKGGIPIPSLFRKLLFAIYFQDYKILFSAGITPDRSELLIRRNVRERIKTIMPHLKLDNDPYLVVAKDALYWIQDAYVISQRYPVSSYIRFSFGNTEEHSAGELFNYIRNSVKITVNAYNGETSLYIVDDKEPLIAAYDNAYPGLFKHYDEMPEELRQHLRYPRDQFQIQMAQYARYHQVKPDQFFENADTWEMARFEKEYIRPYFLTTRLPGCDKLDQFVLLMPITPINRNNLRVLAIAGTHSFKVCGNQYSQGIAIFEFPPDIQVDGPSQVSAMIDQDTDISRQLTLWDQRGSKVERGRMIIMPVGRTLVYIQPVYLVSTQIKIPELKRVIVAMGGEVVMEKSLQEAFDRLSGKIAPATPPGPAAPTEEPLVPTLPSFP